MRAWPWWRAADPAALVGEAAPADGPAHAGGYGSPVPPRLPSLDMWPAALGFALAALLMALSPLYGFHRDELYFLDCARHLQGGYVDQPVLTPLLARASLDLFGVSVVGMRLWPALAAGGTVMVAGLTARELGGGRRAQALAAAATALMPAVLAIGHLAGPTAYDLLAWAALALIIIRIGRTGDLRWWLAAGAVLGVALANKHSVGFFALAVVLGALLSGGRRELANGWFLGGMAIAAAFTIPDIWWQAQHGWATIAMTRRLNQENGGIGNIGSWVAGQVIMVSIALIWLWPAGIRFLWRSGRPLWRALAWAYVLLFVFFAVTTGAKIYYLAGAYVYLLAAGAVAIEGWLAARRNRLPRLLLATGLSTALVLPLGLPVLPAADIGWTYGVNQALGETVGWPELVHTVRSVWLSIPPPQRRNAVIFTTNYGEAGAINELGRSLGLPTAVSGHNNEWWWGPGNPRATTVVVVAAGPRDVTGFQGYLQTLFRRVRAAATLSNTAGIRNQEWGGHVYICDGPVLPWGQLWPQLRHYD